MEKKKNYNIEFLRFIATVGVIFVHVGICWISYYGNTASDIQNLTFSIVQHSCFWAVPVFMMITGSLMMNKTVLTYKNAFKYFKRIAILLVLFGTVFSCMELYFKTGNLESSIFIEGIINMFTGNTWEHLWYLYMLLGIYLLLPALYLLKLTPTNLHILTLLVVIINSILPSLHIKIGIDFPVHPVYVGYFLLGYIINSNSINQWFNAHISDRICISILIITFIVMFTGQYYSTILHESLPLDCSSYTSIFTLIQSVLIFHLIIKRSSQFDVFCSNRLIMRFNRCSLGIYIIHMVWINVFIKVCHFDIMPYGILAIIPIGLFIFLLSWLTTEILIKIPFLNKYL